MSLLLVPDEVIKTEIVSYLDIKDKARLARCSKKLYKIVGIIRDESKYGEQQDKRKKRINKLRYKNDLWKLIQDYPDKNWNWGYLGGNPNIYWDLIKSNPDKPWDPDMISMNPNITWEILMENSDFPKKFGKTWDLSYISANPNITREIIEQNTGNWDPDYVGNNSNITWEILINCLVMNHLYQLVI